MSRVCRGLAVKPSLPLLSRARRRHESVESAPSGDLRQPGAPEASKHSEDASKHLARPSKPLRTAVRSVQRGAPADQVVEHLQPAAERVLHCGATGLSNPKVVAPLDDSRRFLSTDCDSKALLSQYPPDIFPHQNRCCATYFARRSIAKSVDIQRLSRILSDSPRFAARNRKGYATGAYPPVNQQISELRQQTFRANNGIEG